MVLKWTIVAAKSRQSCLTLCDPIDASPPGSLPWDSPGKNTGVGCHFLLQCMKVKSEREVVQSCPTLSDPMDCSPPGSSIHGISRQEYWSGVPLPSLCWEKLAEQVFRWLDIFRSWYYEPDFCVPSNLESTKIHGDDCSLWLAENSCKNIYVYITHTHTHTHTHTYIYIYVCMYVYNLPPCLTGSIFQSYLKCCLPDCSPHFAPNKTTCNLHVVLFFFFFL